jgi:hypothetical protein
MEEFCKRQQIVQDRIFTPKIGEIVNATLETQIYSVMGNSLLITFSSIKITFF